MEQKTHRRNTFDPQPPLPHSFQLDERRKAVIAGVREVLAFDENQVILKTDAGEICLNGTELHVTKLMLEEGQLLVEGHGDGFWYNDPKFRRPRWGKKA